MDREPALHLALNEAGGIRPLARALNRSPGAISEWKRVPRERVFEVAKATGIDPETLRPDLADWIAHRRRQQILMRGRARFALAVGASAVAAGGEIPGEDDMVDLLMILAAARFVAKERRLDLGHIVNGQSKAEETARSRAMALASVIGRAKHGSIAAFFGCSRQNVDNVTVRYLRARDGDDPDDVEDGRVVERGRLRVAKTEGDAAIWAEQHKFEAVLDGRRR